MGEASSALEIFGIAWDEFSRARFDPDFLGRARFDPRFLGKAKSRSWSTWECQECSRGGLGIFSVFLWDFPVFPGSLGLVEMTFPELV